MTQNAQAAWLQNAQDFQKTMADNWAKAFESFQNMDLGALGAKLQAPTVQPPKIAFIPEKLQAVQSAYMQEAGQLIQSAFKGEIKLDDRRFADPAWKANSMAAFAAASYLLNAKTLLALVDAVDTDEKTRARIRFTVEQVNAASAPSNFLLFNAEAQKKAIETQGASITQGVHNLIHDIQQGHVSMTDESLFHVGQNVATTEGAVVFENEYFQLIEYKPLTEKVYERPFLFVPPSINKYYILDLQPDNSMVRYAVSQGHRTFIVSWRNPDASLAKATWDDYIENAVIKAITVTQEISGAKTINALGFCVGGTMLGTALAVLAARGEQPVESVTLLTSMLDFSDTGVLDVFIDENFVRYREAQMGQGGLMKGSDMATTFSFLRPNDLVWNYVVGNYLKGETPPPFDLLYWNSDSTNMPGPFYCWYLRNTYLENNLTKPGKAVVCGQKIDLGKVTIPAYIYGSREDHIVPIAGAYASTRFLGGEKRFVMGASGHIAGVINPPAKKKRNHWIREDGQLPATVDAWLEGAKDVPGSWWTDWSNWLAAHAGKQVAAPKGYGKGKFKVIEPAPGRYVQAKA
ncbi:MAG: class I poly(R)-hydroxyalkanoic acid synthase [Rhodoferax sp.]